MIRSAGAPSYNARSKTHELDVGVNADIPQSTSRLWISVASILGQVAIKAPQTDGTLHTIAFVALGETWTPPLNYLGALSLESADGSPATVNVVEYG